MDSSYYKYCIVPQCTSTSIKTPKKLFIYVPNNQQIRKKWLTLARRNDAHSLSSKSRMYFCEDHFDLPNDMLNYTEYRIMGKVAQVRMKPDCIPSKFGCQEDRRKRTCSSTERSCVLKRQRMTIITECLKEQEETQSSHDNVPHKSLDLTGIVKMTSYKTCTVPMCRSTTIKCPNKLFIHVPKNPERRKQWLQLARRDPQFTSEKSVIFFCEDHFDLPNDMENYIQYSIMGSIGQIRIKPDCLPSKFNCQPDRIKRTGPPQPQSVLENDMDNNIEYKIMGSVKRIRMKPNCLPSRFDCRKRKFTERKPRAAYKKRQRMSLIKEIEEAENKASDTRLPSSIQDPAPVSKETTTYEEEISVKLEPDSEVEPEPPAPEPRPSLCCCCLERAPALPLWPGDDGEQLGRMILSCLQLDLSAFPCAMVCLACAEAARRARSFRQQVARCQQRLMQGPADYGVPVMDNSSASPYVNIADDTLTVVKSEPPDEWSAERDLKADPLKEEELSTAKVEPSEDDPLDEQLVVFSEEDQHTPSDMQDDNESVEVEYLEMEFLDEDEESETERRLEVSEEGRKEVCVQSTATDIVSSQRPFRKADDTGNTASDTGQKAGEEITIRWLTK